eukprot:scaffold316881_cov18-Prasinocladus_malaysianus.AAC.1
MLRPTEARLVLVRYGRSRNAKGKARQQGSATIFAERYGSDEVRKLPPKELSRISYCHLTP